MDAPAIWDNSNIVESYNGVTLPLTFSFVREIYPPVYRQFCRMMGVSASAIGRRDETFENVLGLVRGRLYYNLFNWYRILALLPGYRFNRGFMEQMMGVSEPLPAEHVERIAGEMRGSRLTDAFRLVRTLTGLVANHITIERRVRSFYRRVNDALAPPVVPLADCRPDELVEHYRELRRRLLSTWDAPLVNDFFAMVFYGLLRRQCSAWCGDAAGALQSDLIAGDAGMISAEPARLMRRIAGMAADDPVLVRALQTGSADDIRARLDGHPRVADACNDYLARFGDRTVNELKLESLTLHDDPTPLFRAIGDLACREQAADADRVNCCENSGAAARSAISCRTRLRDIPSSERCCYGLASMLVAGFAIARTFAWSVRDSSRVSVRSSRARQAAVCRRCARGAA